MKTSDGPFLSELDCKKIDIELKLETLPVFEGLSHYRAGLEDMKALVVELIKERKLDAEDMIAACGAEPVKAKWRTASIVCAALVCELKEITKNENENNHG